MQEVCYELVCAFLGHVSGYDHLGLAVQLSFHGGLAGLGDYCAQGYFPEGIEVFELFRGGGECVFRDVHGCVLSVGVYGGKCLFVFSFFPYQFLLVYIYIHKRTTVQLPHTVPIWTP